MTEFFIEISAIIDREHHWLHSCQAESHWHCQQGVAAKNSPADSSQKSAYKHVDGRLSGRKKALQEKVHKQKRQEFRGVAGVGTSRATLERWDSFRDKLHFLQ